MYAEPFLGDPGLQGNEQRLTAETAVPRGTVVSTVWSLATCLARSIYGERFREEGPCTQNRFSAIRDYKETNRDSLPRRQCHVALSSRQCRVLRRALLVRFAQNDSAKRARVRRTVSRRSETTRKRTETHCRDGSATWHCRLDSVESCDVPCSFDLRRTIPRRGPVYAEPFLGDPKPQGNEQRLTAETAVPPGSHVAEVRRTTSFIPVTWHRERRCNYAQCRWASSGGIARPPASRT